MKAAHVVAILCLASTPFLEAALLLPFDHLGCETALDEKLICDDGMKFYRAVDGRCGCLAMDEFYAPEICDAATISCIEFNESFTALYHYNLVNGALLKKAVGCGCFATYDAFVRE